MSSVGRANRHHWDFGLGMSMPLIIAEPFVVIPFRP